MQVYSLENILESSKLLQCKNERFDSSLSLMEYMCGRMIIPPRLQTLSTAALDAGMHDAFRCSLPKVLLY